MRTKLKAITKDLGSQAAVARMLGVDRSRVNRWLRDEDPDPANRHKVEGLELILGRLLALYPEDVAVSWLHAVNLDLGLRRPMFLLERGEWEEVLRAIRNIEGMGYA